MGITLKSTFNAAAKAKQIQEVHKKRLADAIEDEKAKIQIRTEGGQGADGALKQYSKGYAAYKIKKLGTAKVNLTESGQMLAAMTTDVNENPKGLVGRIFFSSLEQGKKAKFNQDLRPNFFKLSISQLKTIVRKIRGQ